MTTGFSWSTSWWTWPRTSEPRRSKLFSSVSSSDHLKESTKTWRIIKGKISRSSRSSNNKNQELEGGWKRVMTMKNRTEKVRRVPSFKCSHGQDFAKHNTIEPNKWLSVLLELEEKRRRRGEEDCREMRAECESRLNFFHSVSHDFVVCNIKKCIKNVPFVHVSSFVEEEQSTWPLLSIQHHYHHQSFSRGSKVYD